MEQNTTHNSGDKLTFRQMCNIHNTPFQCQIMPIQKYPRQKWFVAELFVGYNPGILIAGVEFLQLWKGSFARYTSPEGKALLLSVMVGVQGTIFRRGALHHSSIRATVNPNPTHAGILNARMSLQGADFGPTFKILLPAEASLHQNSPTKMLPNFLKKKITIR